jgi:UDP-N-acetylmuramoylalanine--D-glutamate ligase
MTTVVLGLGRETRAWLADHAPDDVVVLDEAAGEPAITVGGRTLPVVRVDLDDAAAVRDAVASVGAAPATRIVRSPGIAPTRAGVAALVAAGATTATPTGLWLAAAAPDDLVLVTGTKGKSTVAALTAHLLRAAGRRAVLAGNIGTALTTVDPDAPRDDLVVEVSSYQLVDLGLPRPADAAAITTLLVDHVPWHGDVNAYHAAKLRLLDLAAWTVVGPQVAATGRTTGRHDAVAAAPMAAVRAALVTAGMHAAHEAEGAMLALALVARRLRRDATEVADELAPALATFTPLPHRLRPVATVGGVTWVDDSIATIPEAALGALATWRTRGPVTLLLGGEDRGQDLTGLVAALRDDDVRAALLGDLGLRLAAALEAAGVHVDGLRATSAADLAVAVAWAAEVTPSGGAVLLSPAAPSFGAFRDFVHRAETFRDLVLALDTEERP